MEELIISIQDEYEWKVILRTKIYTEEQYKELEEENKKLKEWNNELIENHKKDIAILCEENERLLKEISIKNMAEFLDKKFPKINWFIGEDTLQELRDLGKI